MTVYRTCTNCAVDRASCVRLVEVRRALAGAGITSVKFRCEDRLPLYRPGDRVTTTWLVTDDYDGYNGASEEDWPATVIRESGARFVIAVDDVKSDHGTPANGYFKNANRFAKVPARRLRPLDEPRLTICEVCELIAERGFDECWQTGTAPHQKCLRANSPTIGRAVTGGAG